MEKPEVGSKWKRPNGHVVRVEDVEPRWVYCFDENAEFANVREFAVHMGDWPLGMVPVGD